MTKDKRPQFIPGYLAAYLGTPILTAGELPGGGELFRTCARAVDEEQLPLPGVIQRTDTGDEGA